MAIEIKKHGDLNFIKTGVKVYIDGSEMAVFTRDGSEIFHTVARLDVTQDFKNPCPPKVTIEAYVSEIITVDDINKIPRNDGSE